MINRKNIITILLVVALVAVIYLSVTDRSQHGDPVQWMQEHDEVAARHADLNEFCIDCHEKKRGETKENFCNDCHRKSNAKLIE